MPVPLHRREQHRDQRPQPLGPQIRSDASSEPRSAPRAPPRRRADARAEVATGRSGLRCAEGAPRACDGSPSPKRTRSGCVPSPSVQPLDTAPPARPAARLVSPCSPASPSPPQTLPSGASLVRQQLKLREQIRRGNAPAKMVDALQKLKVIEIARPKASCRRCERMVEGEPLSAIGPRTMASAPNRPIPRSMAGPGLLAHVLVSKFDDHVPLYRQSEILARMGADVPDTTLVDWCGRAMKALQPVIGRVEADVMACDLLHADDTPIRVLDRVRRSAGLGRGVKQGRIWAYVRDQRPWTGPEPPSVVYRFSPDRRGEHPRRHLANSAGILQADAYSGFRELYEPRPRRHPPVPRGGVLGASTPRLPRRLDRHPVRHRPRGPRPDRGALTGVERQIAGQPANERRVARQRISAPKVEAFRSWSETQLARIPGKGDLTRAFRYALKRWSSFMLFLGDGRVCLTTDDVEKPLFPLLSGRLRFGRPVPPGFDHACVRGLRVGDQVHLSVPGLLDPVIPARPRPVAMRLGCAGAKSELAHLHRHEGRPSPAVGFLLGQEGPDQRGDLACGRDRRDVGPLARPDGAGRTPATDRAPRRRTTRASTSIVRAVALPCSGRCGRGSRPGRRTAALAVSARSSWPASPARRSG